MPLGLSWRGSFQTLQRLSQRIDEAEVGLISAGVAFFAFFSLFPALAAIIALWGFASDPGVIRGQVEILRELLPIDAFTLISDQINALIEANDSNLGWATLISTILALWSARAGVAAMIRGLNAVFALPNRASIWHVIRAIFLTLILMGLALGALLAAVVGPLIIAFLPLGTFEVLALEAGNLLLGLLSVVVGIGMIYRLGPNYREGQDRGPLFSWGLVVALLLWVLVSRGFVVYLANFGAYNEVYGSIGAVVALLTWLYLSAYAVMLGAAIDAELQNR